MVEGVVVEAVAAGPLPWALVATTEKLSELDTPGPVMEQVLDCGVATTYVQVAPFPSLAM